MAAADAAYKHTLISAGDVQRFDPGFFGQTPAGMIAAGTPYTAGQLAVIASDDTVFIANSVSIPSGSTGRSNHLFEFDVATPGTLIALFNTTTFSHVIGGNHTVHGQRTYIWDANLLAWESIAASVDDGEPRTMSGSPVGPDFSDYVDGFGKLYVLHWDREAVFNVGGGCVHADTLIRTTAGVVPASRIKIGATVYGWEDGEVRERMVEWVADEWPGNNPRPMVRITVASYGDVTVTANHEMPTQLGIVAAGDLEAGRHHLQGLDGGWRAVGMVERFDERGHVYDIWTKGPSILVNDGIAVGVMERE